MELMEAVWTPAVARVRAGGAPTCSRWPTPRARNIDDRAVGLPLLHGEGAQGAVRPGPERRSSRTCSWTACARGCSGWPGELFGFDFTPRDQRARLPPGRAGVGGEGPGHGRHVGLWYFDPYARPGKRSGAWMNAYRSQERFDGEVTTIVSQQLQLREGGAGRAGAHLLGRRARRSSTSSATRCTGCRSNVTYPSLGGTAVARDYVEFPSQLLEHWLSTPQVLQRFARALPDGRADPAGAGGPHRAGVHLQPGLRHGGVPGQRAGGHEAAPGGQRRHRPATRSSAGRWRSWGCRARS